MQTNTKLRKAYRDNVNYLQALTRLSNPLLVDPSKLDIIATSFLPALMMGDRSAFQLIEDPYYLDEEESLSSESVGIVPIMGSLVSRGAVGSSGTTGYTGVKEHIQEYLNSGITKILFRVDCSGGEVPNCFETGKYISSLSDQGVATAAYVEGIMASGAYGLLAGVDKIIASETAEVGSIGVFSLLINQVKYLQDKKIDWEIFKAGAFKAEGNPYEPFTDESKQKFSARVDYIYDIFIKHVISCRPVLTAEAIRGFESRVFQSEDSLTFKLIDAIGDEQTALNYLINKTTGNVTMTDKSSPKEGIKPDVSLKEVTEKATLSERERCLTILEASKTYQIPHDFTVKSLSKGYPAEMTVDMMADMKASEELKAGLEDSVGSPSDMKVDMKEAEAEENLKVNDLTAAADLAYGGVK